MKKKLMSCLVVLAFMFSIAVPSGFANNNGVATSNGGFTMSIIKEDGLKEENANDPEVTKVTSRITAVYNYAGGVLVSVGDANRGITLISNGKAFASLSYNFEDGTYSFASINLDGLDYDKVKEAGGLKNFLMSIGIPESALQTQQTEYYNGGPVNITASTSDEKVQKMTGGKYKNAEEYLSRSATDVSWLAKAEETLSQGISSGISISFGADGGASLTTMKNGQPRETYSAQSGPDGKLFMTTEYDYRNGFLSSVTNYGFEVDYMKLEDGAAIKEYVEKRDAWLQNNPTKESSDYDKTAEGKKYKAASDAFKNAQDAGTVQYKESKTTTHYNSYGQAAYVERDGKTITQYQYAHNGSLVSSKDLTNNMTTNYIGGKPSVVLNAEGAIVNQYKYNNNGTVNEVITYNNGTAAQRTAFLYGKTLATSDLSKGNITADEMREGYAKMTNTAKTQQDFIDIVKQYKFTNVMAYRGHLSNSAFINFLVSDGSNSAEDLKYANIAKQVMSYNNGISPVATGKFTFGKGESIDSISIDGNTFETEYDENGKVKKDKDGMELTAENKAKKYMHKRIGETNKNFSQLKDAEGNEICNADGTFKEGKSAKDIDLGTSTDKNKKAHEVTVNGSSYETLTVDTTINSYGAAAFTMTCERKFNEKPTSMVLGGYSDPAVIGVVDSFVDADGNVIEKKDIEAYLEANPDAKVYAKVSAEGVNMMDGSGFRAADGEDIFVEVSAEQANEINVGEKAMFMGDVSKSSEGKYIMRTNDNYTVTVNGKEYKGMVTGKDLAAAKAEIQNESAKAMNGESKYAWMNDNTKNNRNLFNLGSGNYLNDWKQGWDILRANLS